MVLVCWSVLVGRLVSSFNSICLPGCGHLEFVSVSVVNHNIKLNRLGGVEGHLDAMIVMTDILLCLYGKLWDVMADCGDIT